MRRYLYIAASLALAAAFALAFNIPASAATICNIFNGCTGTSTAPAYGQLLIGGKNGEYELVASSTFGGGGSGGSGFSTTSAAYWLTQQTTSNLSEGSNLYFTNARAIAALTGQSNSIFTNGAGYLTSLAGAASSTILSDNNTFSGIDSFTNASSNFSGTWQTFSPSHFQTALGFTWPLVNTGGTVSFNGLGTTSNLTAGHIVYSSGAGTITDVATSTLTPSSPLTGSFIQIGSAGSLGIQAASASQNGYESSGSYALIHTATTTFSAPLSYSNSTNAVTCPTCNTTSYTATYPVLLSAGAFSLAFGTSTLATTTSTVWADVNNSNTINNGTISFPFKSVSSMLAGLWSGAPAYAFNLAPGTYVDGAPDTFPNVPFYLSGNESTLVEPSGVTFPNSFDIYDLTIAGNVLESDNNLATIHQFNNGVISGNLQMDGLGLLSGMVVTGGQYFLISTSSISNIAATLVQNPIWANGTVNINDDQISTTTSSALVSATTTSFTSTGQFGNVDMIGATLINPGGPGINIQNGATSTINNLTGFTVQVNSNHSLMVGNSKTAVCDFQSNNLLTGGFVAPEASSTSAWVPCNDEALNVLQTLGVATTTSLTGNAVEINGNLGLDRPDTGQNVFTITPSSNGINFNTQNSNGNQVFQISGTEVFRIRNNGMDIGNNGGTIPPTNGLYVQGNVAIGTTTTTGPLLALAGTTGILASTTATSTFIGGGINLITGAGNTGCFAVNGTCITSGGSSASSTLLGDNNTFTGKDIFSNATTTLLTATTEWLPSLGTAAGTFLAVDPNGKIIATSTPAVGGGGTVTSVAANNGITGGTITTSGTLSLVSYIATSSLETGGQIPYWTTTSGNPAKLGSVATSSLGVTGPITFSGTLFAQIGGTGGNFGCTTASSGVTGCLAGADWTTFNNKISSSSLSASLPLTYNSGTGAFSSLFSTTTNTGIGNNLFLYTNNSGVIVGAASSSLNLPNAALQNSSTSFTSGDSSLTVPASINLGSSGSFVLNLGHSNVWTASTTFQQQLNVQGASTTLLGTGTFWNTGITSALGLFDANHKETAYAGSSNPCAANQAPTTISALGALGGCTSTFLTGNQTVTLTGDVTGSGATAVTTAFNLANSHWWTATQNFTNASTSQFTATSSVWFTGITAGSLLATDANQKLIATTTIGDNLLQNTAVTAGSYTNTNLTVNAQGIITAASNGSAGSGGAWPFTTGLSTFGTAVQATTTPEWFQNGLYSSSTVALSSTGGPSMYWDATNGRLGIGTFSPSEMLHLSKPTGNFTTMRFDSGATQGYFFAYDGTPEVSMGSNSNAQLNFKVNNATEAFIPTGQGGFTDQSSIGQHSFLNLIAPQNNAQESTLTEKLNQAGNANSQFIDWTLENYGTDNQGSINISKAGASTTVPFSIRFWNSDLGNIAANGVYAATWLPNGTMGVGVSTSTAGFATSTVLYAASSTATNIFALDSTPGNRIFTVQGQGNLFAGTSTPGWGLLTLASSTKPQLSLSDGIAADPEWALRNVSGNFYLASSTASATSTNAALAIFTNAPPSLSVGTTTSTENDGIENLGLDPTSGAATSTIVLTGKIAIQGLNAQGAIVCLFVTGSLATTTPGACTP